MHQVVSKKTFVPKVNFKSASWYHHVAWQNGVPSHYAMWHVTSPANTSRPESPVPHCVVRWRIKAFQIQRTKSQLADDVTWRDEMVKSITSWRDTALLGPTQAGQRVLYHTAEYGGVPRRIAKVRYFSHDKKYPSNADYYITLTEYTFFRSTETNIYLFVL